jgi:nickel-dependent lactate racemase
MRVAVHVGTKAIELDVGEKRLVELRSARCAAAIPDVADAVAQAVEQPLAFPPLRQAIVPGDHVAIVLDDGIPNPGSVLSPLIECLADAGVEPKDIVIVQVPRREDGRHRLTPNSLPPGIRLAKHDPHDRNRLSYLASTKAGTRVYLNREVVDADLVVLVGRVDFHPILGYSGTSSSVFPGLSDAAAQQLFRGKIVAAAEPKTMAAARHESDEVAWLLGVQFAIQVVVGKDEQVVAVLAGNGPDVQGKAQRRLDCYWQRTASTRAELVIAVIGGEPMNQGFEELGMALSSSMALVRDGGRVAVLSAIGAAPGPALRAARDLQDPARSLELLKRQPSADAISTWQIIQACRRVRVYLLSRLENELVEDLSMTPLASMTEVERLIQQCDSCIILDDAPLTRAVLESDNE